MCVCVPVASPLPPHVSASRRTCSTPQVLVPGAGAVPASSCLGELLEVMLHMFRVFRSLPSCIPQHCSFTKPCQGRRQQGGPVPGSPTPLHLQAEACHAPLPGPTIACWGNTAGGLIPKPGFHVECGCRQGKCNFGGRHGRNNAAGWRLRGCRAQNLQLSQDLCQVLPRYRTKARGCSHHGRNWGVPGKAVPAAGENVILGAGMPETLPQGGVSQGAGPGIYNYRRLFRQVLPGYRAQARGCIHGGFRGRNWPQPEKM